MLSTDGKDITVPWYSCWVPPNPCCSQGLGALASQHLTERSVLSPIWYNEYSVSPSNREDSIAS